MQRLPGETDNDYFRRWCEQVEVQRKQELAEARQLALESGKEPFDYDRFARAYQSVKSLVPERDALEREYYLDYPATENLQQFLQAVARTDLYDGGDMHLHEWDVP